MERPQPHSAIVIEALHPKLSGTLHIWCADDGAHAWLQEEAPHFGHLHYPIDEDYKLWYSLTVQPNYDLQQVIDWLGSYNGQAPVMRDAPAQDSRWYVTHVDRAGATFEIEAVVDPAAAYIGSLEDAAGSSFAGIGTPAGPAPDAPLPEWTCHTPGDMARMRERILELAYDCERAGNLDQAATLRAQARLNDTELLLLYGISTALDIPDPAIASLKEVSIANSSSVLRLDSLDPPTGTYISLSAADL